MVDKLLNFGSMFDWITPIFTFVQDYQNRPSLGYCIPIEAGWSAFQIRALLTSAGVKLWGLALFDEVITFRVRTAQARYTQYLLDHQGIPYRGGVATGVSPLAAQTHRPESPIAPTGNLLDSWPDGIRRIIDML